MYENGVLIIAYVRNKKHLLSYSVAAGCPKPTVLVHDIWAYINVTFRLLISKIRFNNESYFDSYFVLIIVL
ncbi:hypothetical protein XBFM1_1220005 [Xenorhabdus bovienii str. feltiae Moldova]|uniref:Uncharacterized protein n=1 Tax=Xenorhabdus bovienii str. feltiae Moldova TaxID=1398200 RepID=A0A077NN54_XENBV|nr:hypothetical protein XBFM1_1220005 [Xenorhabdus bovienii str. feltiae Moldova]